MGPGSFDDAPADNSIHRPAPNQQGRQAIMLGLTELFTRSSAMALLESADICRFQIVCVICDGLGIVFDCREDASESTLIKCRHCGAPRGTLGELRLLSYSGKKSLFEL